MFRTLIFVSFSLALFVYSVCDLPGQCVCPPIPTESAIVVQKTTTPNVKKTSNEKQSERAACRVTVSGSCGSGSVVGHYRGGSLIMTNAHVVGTRVGTVATCEFDIDGSTVRKRGRIIEAAYSDRTLTDWAVLLIEDWQEIEPVKMSKNRPTGTHYSKGSPRCVWPLRSIETTTVDMSNNGPLWRWRPNSIGGQSGSGVWSKNDDQMYGLLTWSWGGFGAGQMTSEIYRQSKNRTVSGEPRVDGLTEVSGSKVDVENGYFAESNIDTLPIWSDGDDDDPDPIDEDLSNVEKQLLGSLRSKAKEYDVEYEKLVKILSSVGELTSDESKMMNSLKKETNIRNIDFVRLIELIIELIGLFGSNE